MVKIHKDEIVSFSVKKLIENQFRIENFFIAYMVHTSKRWLLQMYLQANALDVEEALSDLLAEEYLVLKKDEVGITINNLASTEKLSTLLSNKVNSEDVEDWIDEWYDLWPVGVKSGGLYVRTDKRGTLRKMKSFNLQYPMYDKDTIFQATKNYLLDQSIRGYSYCKLAPYFIYKDGMSILAGECENLDEDLAVDTEQYGAEEI